jgi:sugar lactone lactonase YvrE
VLRVEKGGLVLEEVSTGDQGVFACALGGPDRRTLFLCVAPDFSEHLRAGAREAAIWSMRVEVPGAGLP